MLAIVRAVTNNITLAVSGDNRYSTRVVDTMTDDKGKLAAGTKQQAIQWIGQQVQNQAAFLGHMDAFWVLTLISLAAALLALALRKIKLSSAAPVGH
jgi:hypothetical protein